ncbi:hypothetical protein OSB04_023687 [Centaurea solstitialis]|uniref:Zinc finger, CCHC-type n=1 Tax=Centaurea solstitialis TaxID=347529 RepID=A0AA38W9P0_9ASTR|nr:hypothetical protein OSB04_023687 [Centaurea solstitialis]
MWAINVYEKSLVEHYGLLKSYGDEILRNNLGSTVKLDVTTNPDEMVYFDRLYVCLQALKERWKKCCKRIIAIDRCFLKGVCQGELITAIGKDGNNHIFPIAWTVVNVENKENWTRSLFWKAAKASYQLDYERVMDQIKAASPNAYDYLVNKDPKTWSRAFFEVNYACEAVENGFSECFNAILEKVRSKPIITMLEAIRAILMERMKKMRRISDGWNSVICPTIQKKLEHAKTSQRYWDVIPGAKKVIKDVAMDKGKTVAMNQKDATVDKGKGAAMNQKGAAVDKGKGVAVDNGQGQKDESRDAVVASVGGFMADARKSYKDPSQLIQGKKRELQTGKDKHKIWPMRRQAAARIAKLNVQSKSHVQEEIQINQWIWISDIVLRHERKWYVLEEPLAEAPPANATTTVRNAYRKHFDDLLDVGCLMLATLSPELQTGLMNTNAYDMIRQLRDMFQTQACTEHYDATRALNACKMAKGTSVSAHVMKMKRHIDYLERLGHPVPLQLATDTILNSLSEDYKQFVINYNMNNIDKTITELHSMLKTAELSIGTKTKDVLMVRDGGVKKKRGHGNTIKGTN